MIYNLTETARARRLQALVVLDGPRRARPRRQHPFARFAETDPNLVQAA